jgi:dTDP-4-dehydrorhamnose reductase
VKTVRSANRALVTGANGQLGTELAATAPPSWEVIALGRDRLDISSREQVFDCVALLKPRVILNAAAYTKVEQAEAEPELAFAVNDRGTWNLAAVCSDFGSRLIHVSTDYVFDGNARAPYTIADAARPINVYGASKLAGEQRIFSHLPDSGCVFRTSWLYSNVGQNFPRTVLNRIANRQPLCVVGDQIGCPTWTRSLTRVLWAAADDDSLYGLFHWSDAEPTSWYEFAVAIQEEGFNAGLVKERVDIRRVRTAEYPTKTPRPSYTVLDSSGTVLRTGVRQRSWRANLRSMIRRLKTHPDGGTLPL